MKKSRNLYLRGARSRGWRMLTQAGGRLSRPSWGQGASPLALCGAHRLGLRPLKARRLHHCDRAGGRLPVGAEAPHSKSDRKKTQPTAPTTQQGAVRPLQGRRCPGRRGSEHVTQATPAASVPGAPLPRQMTSSLSSRSVTASKLSPSPPAQTLPLWAARPLLT